MGDIDVKASRWRLVEVGRIVLFTHGTHTGKLATIVQIIDHKRILVDGPTKDEAKTVPRHAAAIRDITLTPIVLIKLPRAAGTGAVRKVWEKSEVEKKWSETSWAKKHDQQVRRKGLTDFERFKVMKLRKQTRWEVRKSVAKIRSKAKA
ncbi:MAG: hypothetical protein M1814_004296 [Vezdaea aestivalis]|nr:MAG: hypothetical protein M1814_004296 [Vezdaea aestivalis]